jgi:VWFA-related protein
MTKGSLTFAALPLVLLVLGATAAAQFHSRTDLVELGAVVLDKDGAPVSNLGREDFELLEDGHRVPISTFAAIDADHPATLNDGRFLALLVEPHSPTARKLARQLIDRMGARDVVAVLGMTGSKATTTDSREVALKQLDDLTPTAAARRPIAKTAIGNLPQDNCRECGVGGVSSGWLGYPGATRLAGNSGMVLGTLGIPSSGSASDPGVAGTSSYAITALGQMQSLADQLTQVPHRHKSVIYIGPGSKLNLTERSVKDGDSGRWFDVVKHASRANVSVSVVSIDGLTGKSYDGARMLADETGGDAIVDTNVYDQGLESLWQRAGQYYLLGYTPGSDKKRRHAIEVRVEGPNVEVHALKARD